MLWRLRALRKDSGADAITVHARTADQGYSGVADWKVIAEVKKKR